MGLPYALSQQQWDAAGCCMLYLGVTPLVSVAAAPHLGVGDWISLAWSTLILLFGVLLIVRATYAAAAGERWAAVEVIPTPVRRV